MTRPRANRLAWVIWVAGCTLLGAVVEHFFGLNLWGLLLVIAIVTVAMSAAYLEKSRR